jgi:hypothetical protein
MFVFHNIECDGQVADIPKQQCNHIVSNNFRFCGRIQHSNANLPMGKCVGQSRKERIRPTSAMSRYIFPSCRATTMAFLESFSGGE